MDIRPRWHRLHMPSHMEQKRLSVQGVLGSRDANMDSSAFFGPHENIHFYTEYFLFSHPGLLG